jgi:HEAT repeat protein
MSGGSSSESTPAHAPFAEVYRERGSFLSVMLKTVADVFGSDPLIEAQLKMDGRFFGGNQTIVDGRFFNCRSVLLDELGGLRDEHTIGRLTAVLVEEASSAEGTAMRTLKTENYGNQTSALLGALSDDREAVRSGAARALRKISAAQALARMKDPGFVPALTGLLKEPLAVLREEGASALEALGDVRAVEPLLSALKDQDPKVRRASASALGKMKDARAVSPLSRVLGERAEDRDVRRAALESLSELGATEGLIAALQDRDEIIRHWAAIRLGWAKEVRAIEPLIGVLGERGYADLRSAAVAALQRITGQNFGQDHQAWMAWWEKQPK